MFLKSNLDLTILRFSKMPSILVQVQFATSHCLFSFRFDDPSNYNFSLPESLRSGPWSFHVLHIYILFHFIRASPFKLMPNLIEFKTWIMGTGNRFGGLDPPRTLTDFLRNVKNGPKWQKSGQKMAKQSDHFCHLVQNLGVIFDIKQAF